MAKAVHITTARKMIDSGDPVDLKVWAKDGRVLHLQNCIGLRYNFRSGTRQVKLLTSRQIIVRALDLRCIYLQKRIVHRHRFPHELGRHPP